MLNDTWWTIHKGKLVLHQEKNIIAIINGANLGIYTFRTAKQNGSINYRSLQECIRECEKTLGGHECSPLMPTNEGIQE